jgi:hypothetical protein
MSESSKYPLPTPILVAAAWLTIAAAQADLVTDWNAKAVDIVTAAKLPPHPSYRTMATVQAAVYEAVNAINGRHAVERGRPDASVEAAVAAANRGVLSKLLPAQEATIESAYQTALASIPAGAARTSGLAIGEKAASAVLSRRADDGAGAPESYRPRTTAGTYVPTALPAFPQWPQRKPWVMASAGQFRPGPPPSLASERWVRDYNEIKALGAKTSAERSAEQTSIARFWEATGPGIYFPVVRSVASAPGRDLTRNARLLAAAGVAMDDALIAVMDAKYHYHFWRPITAIRNGDGDGNDATERDPSWTPLIDTPMHPEYPCAHCILAGSIGAVLRAEVGTDPVPPLTTTSVTSGGASRSWDTIEGFVQEVANARVYDGVHYRSSTEVGTHMGEKIGQLTAAKYAIARP